MVKDKGAPISTRRGKPSVVANQILTGTGTSDTPGVAPGVLGGLTLVIVKFAE